MTHSERISSPSNPRVRGAAKLREADARRETGLTLVDGRRELSRAFAAGVEVVDIFLDADSGDDASHESWLDDCAARGARVVEVPRKVFEKIAFGSRNEGLVGVVRFAAQPLDRFRPAAGRPVLVVEGVEKPGNLGAILRTADAAGIAGVIACGPGTDPANPACIRASLGAVFSVPLAIATSEAAIDWCRDQRRRVMAALPDGDTLWHEAPLSGDTAIVLGSEAHGLSTLWREAAAEGRISLHTVRLPMLGITDSLNVSVTAAILAYEALRQGSHRSPKTP
ncbi:MAG: TrmH family RNA methyltransferase [Planctomycetia bacterium]